MPVIRKNLRRQKRKRSIRCTTSVTAHTQLQQYIFTIDVFAADVFTGDATVSQPTARSCASTDPLRKRVGAGTAPIARAVSLPKGMCPLMSRLRCLAL